MRNTRGGRGGWRRWLATLVGLAVSGVLLLGGVPAMAAIPPLVGLIEPGAEDGLRLFPRAIVGELARRGLREGEHYRLLVRYAAQRDDRLEAAIHALVAARPDILVGFGIKPIRMMMTLAPTTPIVTTGSGNLIGQGMIKSLAAPGGMLTGIVNGEVQHGRKPLDLMRQAFPKLKRVGIVFNPTNPGAIEWHERMKRGEPQAQGFELAPVWANTPETVATAFADLARRGVRHVYIPPDWINLTPAWSAAARRHWLALVGWKTALAEDGGLFSMGLLPDSGARLAARYVDAILKGAKPAELPMETNQNNVLVVNLKNARRLGISLPREFIARADRIVE